MIGGLAYFEARRSGHASERSAMASEQSSQAAIESNAFQRQVWREQRSADVVFDLAQSSIRFPPTSEMYLLDAVFRNEGELAARDVGLGLAFDAWPPSWLTNVGDLPPGDSRTFQTHFEQDLVGEASVGELTMRLTYRDRVGRHFVRIPISFQIDASGSFTHLSTGTVTHRVAAEVHRTTAYRWMGQPAFTAALREADREVLNATSQQLARLGTPDSGGPGRDDG